MKVPVVGPLKPSTAATRSLAAFGVPGKLLANASLITSPLSMACSRTQSSGFGRKVSREIAQKCSRSPPGRSNHFSESHSITSNASRRRSTWTSLMFAGPASWLYSAISAVSHRLAAP